MTLDSVVQSYASWTGHISHGNTYHLRQNMDAYFFSLFPGAQTITERRTQLMAQKLSNLANKSKVKFGSLYGSPIVWIVADKNHAGYPSNSVTLVTNQIIKMLCFDATEPSNGNSDRHGYGNNRYIYSNLRQWLNSPAAAGQWYTAQHSADQTPDSPTSGTASTRTVASPVF